MTLRLTFFVLFLGSLASSQTTTPNLGSGSVNGALNPVACSAANPPSWCAGSDVGAWTNAAIRQSNYIWIPPGNYIQKTPITPNCATRIFGYEATVNYSGSDYQVKTTYCQSSPFAANGGIHGLSLSGSSAGSGGIHVISTIAFELEDVAVWNYTNGVGVLIDNQGGGYTERFHMFGYCSLGNNLSDLTFTNTSGTKSVGYADIQGVHLQVLNNQIGMTVNGVSLYGAFINLKVNEFLSGGNSAYAIQVTNGGSIGGADEPSTVFLSAENASGSGTGYGIYVDGRSSIYATGSINLNTNLANKVAGEGSFILGPPPAWSNSSIPVPLYALTKDGLILGAGAAKPGYEVIQRGTGALNGISCAQFDMYDWNVGGGMCFDSNGNLALAGEVVPKALAQSAPSQYAGVSFCSGGTKAISLPITYRSQPVILVFDETTKGGANLSAKSAIGFTVSCTGASDIFDWMVVGNPN
jgi:hypothetical protein